ncbi:MAG: AbrB/MazE/SpoVT family DNA-binding domain-containing protein [Ruminococcus sp.]|nr:AbrB/MazE/SpoVT family DNA-binding domain-containing protein [Ruminococcus sp.]
MIYKTYKPIDPVGRIVIPKDFRDAVGFREGEDLLIEVEDGRIVLSKAEQTCVFCDRTAGLRSYMGKTVCENCIKHLTNSAK